MVATEAKKSRSATAAEPPAWKAVLEFRALVHFIQGVPDLFDSTVRCMGFRSA